MDLRKVKKLMELLESSGMAEIEIKEGEESVRISRYGEQAPIAQPISIPQPVIAAPTDSNVSTSEPEKAAIKGHPITSPMVGTFYAAASPTSKPFVEVHLSNVYKREDFRHKSYFSDIALGVISGLGSDGYSYALNFAINYLKK